MDNARKLFPGLDFAEGPMEAAQDAELVLHLTEWQEFRALDPAAVRAVVAVPRIIDGRNALDSELWRAEGWNYRGLGRP
jgi:UDPglucose 6-dehydrogenase